MTSKAIKCVCIFCFMTFVAPAQALIVLQQVTVPSSVEHETNPELVENDKQSIWRYTTTPTYTISAVDNTDRWFGTAALRLQRSSNKSISVDREDPLITLGWERGLERGTFKLLGNYEKNSIRSTEFKRTGVVNADGDEITKSMLAEWSRLLTERLTLTLNGKLQKTEYTTGDLVDFSTQDIGSNLSYQLNQKVDVFGILNFSKFSPDDQSGDERVMKYLAGAKIQLNPNLVIIGAAGWNKISSTGYSMIGNASFEYVFDRHTLYGRLERSTNPTGESNLLKSDRASLTYDYKLSDTSKLGSDFSWSKNYSESTSRTLGLGGYYAREISDRWAMKFYVDMRELKDNIKTVNSEIAGISFTYSTPQF